MADDSGLGPRWEKRFFRSPPARVDWIKICLREICTNVHRKTILPGIQTKHKDNETFIFEDHTKKIWNNIFKTLNQNHIHHIVIINTAAKKNRKMQHWKPQISANNRKLQHWKPQISANNRKFQHWNPQISTNNRKLQHWKPQISTNNRKLQHPLKLVTRKIQTLLGFH